MPKTTVTTFDATTGAVLAIEDHDLPDEPAPDVTVLADQLSSLTAAVNELILNALMGL